MNCCNLLYSQRFFAVFRKNGAVALRVIYTTYRDNLMINLLYLVVHFLIAQPL